MQTLEEYLEENNAPSTVKRYVKEIEKFKKACGGSPLSSVENPQKASYGQIMDYLGLQRKRYKNVQTIVCVLSAIKKYYSYLIAINQRKDNPAKSIRLRDNKHRDIQLQDLFSSEELETLMERKERYSDLKTRNRVIISLLIYQALTTGEIVKLTLDNINLKEGTIYIKQGLKSNSRTLKLQTTQIMLLHEYIHQTRSKLLKVETNQLIISKVGNPESGEQISYLIGTFKKQFPGRNLNPKTIRQSVITNLLKEKDLRKVQVFAGHKYPSATEKYKQSDVEELKNEVLKYHPLQ
jgi:integrase/recombinase XerD